MNKMILEDNECNCAATKVIIVYPETSSNDDNIKHEVREIMIAELYDQLLS